MVMDLEERNYRVNKPQVATMEMQLYSNDNLDKLCHINESIDIGP